jgi:hypothetical protein
MRAGTAQHTGFQNVFSPETGRKQMATHHRPTPPEQVMQGPQTHVRDTHTPQEANACRRLDGLLRPRGRLLHTRHTGGGQTLLYGKLSRDAVPSSRTSDGLEMQQILFMPAYRSFYPSLTRTAAQPHRAQPPYIYEPTAHATETFPTLSVKLAMEMRPLTPVIHGRLFFADNRDTTLHLRDRVASLLNRLGLGRNPQKGHSEPTQICEHLGLQIDTTTSTFRAPPSKLQAIATLSRTMLQRYARDARWLPAL